MRDIGKNIRTARVRAGMTQDELAEQLHVSRQTVSNYETSRFRPDIDMLFSIAEALGMDVSALLYGSPLPPEAAKPKHWKAPPDTKPQQFKKPSAKRLANRARRKKEKQPNEKARDSHKYKK